MRNVERRDPVPLDSDRRWRPLFVSDDAGKAQMVATCIAAMEYEVHLVGGDEPGRGRFADRRVEVRVPESDWEVLAEILDDLIEEQEQFDEFIGGWHRGASRAERRLLVLMIVIVGALGVAGVVEL